MSAGSSLQAKLGLDVFKPGGKPHIRIKPGMEKDQNLRKMAAICPAGLYSEGNDGAIVLSIDGCLECGTCRLICGPDVLDWQYPEGGVGVQYRFG